MKEMDFPGLLKKFLPDLIILVGVTLFLNPQINAYNPLINFGNGGYQTDWDKIGIIIIALGIDIAARRFLKN